MQVPFEGFVVPPLAYTAFLVVGVAVVIAAVYTLRPPITQRTVLAFVPWIVSGSALHVFYQLGELYRVQLYPPVLAPLFSAPAVYLTTFVAMGTAWLLSIYVGPRARPGADDSISQYLGAFGLGLLISLVGLVLWHGSGDTLGPLEPVFPLLGIGLTVVVTAATYAVLNAWQPQVIAQARLAGTLVLFAHLLDGITTAIGADFLEVGERSVLSARILEFAAGLPTEPLIGAGWLFAVVKLLLAALIVLGLAEFVEEDPVQGNLFLAVVVALGLGPAMNNVFLFLLGVP